MMRATIVAKGNPLTDARAAAGYSVRSLADASGVNKATISRIEAGSIPTTPVALALVSVLYPDSPPSERRAFADKLHDDCERWAAGQASEVQS